MQRDPKIKTLKRLLSPYLVISSKTRVCSAWSELAEFRANTSKFQRSTSCEGDQSKTTLLMLGARRACTTPLPAPVWCPTFCPNTRWAVRRMTRWVLPSGSLQPLQVGLAGLPCRPSWTSWNNAMFMLSSVRVQMMTLCSELVSWAVYRKSAQSRRRPWKDVLEGKEG